MFKSASLSCFIGAGISGPVLPGIDGAAKALHPLYSTLSMGRQCLSEGVPAQVSPPAPVGPEAMGGNKVCDIINNVIMDEAIRVEGLVKRFGSFTAIDQVSFAVAQGEIFGILGPNGAGKTTTLEIIEGLQPPTQGQITVLGRDIKSHKNAIKARIGVQLQSSAYYDFLTLKEILALLGSFYPTRTSPENLLQLVGLSDKANSYVNQLSGGQKQRFTVVASLVNEPGVGDPGRAHHRVGPTSPAQSLGIDPGNTRQGCHTGAYHPLHGGSPGPLRPVGYNGPGTLVGGGLPQEPDRAAWKPHTR